MRNRGKRRYTSRMKEKRRLNLATALCVDSDNKQRLAKNGWSCSCGLCKPYQPKSRLSKKELEELIKDA